jgi:hypothetical protein
VEAAVDLLLTKLYTAIETDVKIDARPFALPR